METKKVNDVVENAAEVTEDIVEVDGGEIVFRSTDAAEHAVKDYKITAGDVAIMSLTTVGICTVGYGIFKGGKKLYEYIKNKREEKLYDNEEFDDVPTSNQEVNEVE